MTGAWPLQMLYGLRMVLLGSHCTMKFVVQHQILARHCKEKRLCGEPEASTLQEALLGRYRASQGVSNAHQRGKLRKLCLGLNELLHRQAGLSSRELAYHVKVVPCQAYLHVLSHRYCVLSNGKLCVNFIIASRSATCLSRTTCTPLWTSLSEEKRASKR